MQTHPRGAGKRNGLVEQIAQRNAFPDRVAHQARVQSVADAHERGFLLGRCEAGKILKSPRSAILYKPAYFEMPEINVHLGINNILCDAIKQFVRCDRLDDLAFVLCAVITECCDSKKLASQRKAATGHGDSYCAQDKRAPANGRTEFVLVPPGFSCRQKLKTSDNRSLEQKNAQREAYERDQARDIDGQADIACAEHWPQCDCERNDR